MYCIVAICMNACLVGAPCCRQASHSSDDSFEARCRAADEALTAIINRRDADVAARAAAGQPPQ